MELIGLSIIGLKHNQLTETNLPEGDQNVFVENRRLIMPILDPKIIFLPSGKRGTVPTGTTILNAARGLNVDLDSVWRAEYAQNAKFR